MFKIRRNDIEISIDQDVSKPYLWVGNEHQMHLVGQFKDNKSAKLFQNALDYISFGNKETEVREMLDTIC